MSPIREQKAETAERFVEEGNAFAQLSGLSKHGERALAVRRDEGQRRHFDVIVIGGGQAGLSVGYHLKKRGLSFLILEGNERVGDSWRKRWDSLRLFTPAKFNGLDGMPFPAPPNSFPTKDEMADYLESYTRTFELPVRTGTKVDKLSREGDRYVVRVRDQELEADQVVIAMANYQARYVPDFARELRPDIVQIHSSEYRNPSQLKKGDVLIVGAGNSGAEIALDLARHHRVLLSGRDTGHIPFRINSFWGRLFLVRFFLRVVFHRIMTLKTPMGRKMRSKMLNQGGPLVRQKPRDLLAAGVERIARVSRVEDGRPVLEDGTVLDVANVVWSTGYDSGLSWVDLPIFDENGEPRHQSGVVENEPGLFFVGRLFLHAASSVMVHGVGRDAARIAGDVTARRRQPAYGQRVSVASC